MNYKLRPRQEIAVDNMITFINSNKDKGVFVYPTSFGKSIIIANVADKFPKSYFINVTSSKELVKQNFEKFTSYGLKADICSASLNSNDVGKITFATIGTLVKHANYLKDKSVILLHDECHLSSKSGSILDEFTKKLNNVKLIGTTATPFRLSASMSGTMLKMMNKDRDCIYKTIEDIVQIKDVVDDGYWSKLIYEDVQVDESSLQLNGSGTEYTDTSIKKFNEDNDIINLTITQVNRLIEQGRKSILVSVPFIEDATKIASLLGTCEAVYSGMDSKDRDRIINDFKELKLKVVVQVSILSVGFDHPQLDAVIMSKPTNSLTFFYQILGRLVRIHPSKKDGLVVDLSGNYRKFGRIEDLSIEKQTYTRGWACFSGDNLLTNFPLNTLNRPTRKSLIYKEKYKAKQDLAKPVIFTFGKYKDKTVDAVYKENKSYLTWILDQKDFNWFGESGKNLKKAIEIKLGVYMEILVESKSPNVKNIMVEYTEKYRNVKDLSEIF